MKAGPLSECVSTNPMEASSASPAPFAPASCPPCPPCPDCACSPSPAPWSGRPSPTPSPTDPMPAADGVVHPRGQDGRTRTSMAGQAACQVRSLTGMAGQEPHRRLPQASQPPPASYSLTYSHRRAPSAGIGGLPAPDSRIGTHLTRYARPRSFCKMSDRMQQDITQNATIPCVPAAAALPSTCLPPTSPRSQDCL